MRGAPGFRSAYARASHRLVPPLAHSMANVLMGEKGATGATGSVSRARATSRCRTLVAASVAIAGTALSASPSFAEPCDDPKRCPIPSNRYALDLFQGPLLAPISVTGIAGAYAGYAEGIAGMVANAAAPAVREPYSVSYFEIDGSGSISFPLNFFGNDDFDNSGSPGYDYSNFIYGTLGGVLQYGPLGGGYTAELQRYSLTDKQGQTTSVNIGKYHVLGGVRLLGDQLVLGAGARFVTLGIGAKKDLTMF